VSDQKDKPVFDEQTLAKLLEAAYVLQEHNREMQALGLELELKSGQLREQQPQAPTLSGPSQVSSTLGPEEESRAHDDYTLTLAQIVETQHQIQVRQLALENAMALVAERAAQITAASGAAIGVVEGKIVRYQAGSGSPALPVGSEVPMEKALCFGCLRTGQAVRVPDVNPEFLLDAEECHRRGIQALIAVPVYHHAGIAGALELYFGRVQGFREQDVHTCQLMAGLLTEALTRAEQLTWKKSQAAERATMLEALEKLKPNLSALVETQSLKNAPFRSAGPGLSAEPGFVCRKCGHELVGEEQFCGKCGTPRIRDDDEAPTMQSKVASLWQMQQKGKESPAPPSNGASAAGLSERQNRAEPRSNEQVPSGDTRSQNSAGDDRSEEGRSEEDRNEEDRAQRELARLLANSVPDFAVARDSAPADFKVSQNMGEPGVDTSLGSRASAAQLMGPHGAEDAGMPELPLEAGVAHAETALTKTADDITWTSAAKARDFLEQVAVGPNQSALRGFWNTRRGDIYLAVAVILMAVVIRWGLWSNHTVDARGNPTVAAASHRKPDADLSFLDRMLIHLGLAEAPEAPEPKGNPETQVWVDLHTALYYCPGTDLYGKTPRGKFTTQRDAQLDAFEPAYRKACE
jgi:GAF domain-containing protein